MSGHEDLREIAQRVSAVGEDAALLDGRPLMPSTPPPWDDAVLPDRAPSGPGSPAGQRPSGAGDISWLARQLYGHCYVRPVPRSRPSTDTGDIGAYRRALSDANAGQGHWEAGWEAVDGSTDR